MCHQDAPLIELAAGGIFIAGAIGVAVAVLMFPVAAGSVLSTIVDVHINEWKETRNTKHNLEMQKIRYETEKIQHEREKTQKEIRDLRKLD